MSSASDALAAWGCTAVGQFVMLSEERRLRCDHCGAELDAIEYPDGGGWEGQPHWVCFNDQCPYYRDGWDWMWEQYRVKASYRFRVLNPETWASSPLPVWSDTAIRDRIIDGAQTFRDAATEEVP